MEERFAYDVFLSHSAKDKPRVRRLAERLKEAGLRVWFDEWAIRPGDDIYIAVERGLQDSRTQVLCLSQSALESDWVKIERSTVLFRDPTNEGRRFIPMLLSDCKMPDTLRRYKYVDFRKESDENFAELLAASRPEEKALPAPRKPLPTKRPTYQKPQPQEPPEQNEPLALQERKLTGHEEWVNSVAVSPDGTWAASGSTDNTIRIWDLETGKCRAMLEGHTGDVESVVITPDGKQVISGSRDDTIRIWDAAEGNVVADWQASKHFVLSVAIISGGRRVLSSGAARDPVLKIWDVATRQCLATLKGHGEPVYSVAVSQDEKRAVSGSVDETVRIWDLDKLECLSTLKGHSNGVNSVQITPEGRFAVSGSNDKTLKVWDLAAGICVGTLEGHQGTVDSVAISPDGTLIASAGYTDQTVRLWDWESRACLQVIENEDQKSPISVAFSPDGSRLLAGTTDSTIYVYRLAGVRYVPSAKATRRYVNAKIVLIGEGTVGKTSLAHRLIKDRYVVRDRTHGMNVWRMDLALPQHDSLEREALLWDLAGQEDYRLIHQLFL